jgi:hypothetical protein
MSTTVKDFVGVEEISSPMSQSEYDSFLERRRKKGYINHADIGKDGSAINPNEQVLAGAKFLVENKIGM